MGERRAGQPANVPPTVGHRAWSTDNPWPLPHTAANAAPAAHNCSAPARDPSGALKGSKSPTRFPTASTCAPSCRDHTTRPRLGARTSRTTRSTRPSLNELEDGICLHRATSAGQGSAARQGAGPGYIGASGTAREVLAPGCRRRPERARVSAQEQCGSIADTAATGASPLPQRKRSVCGSAREAACR